MPKRAECTICLTNYARVLRKTYLAIPCTNWILAIVVYLKTICKIDDVLNLGIWSPAEHEVCLV